MRPSKRKVSTKVFDEAFDCGKDVSAHLDLRTVKARQPTPFLNLPEELMENPTFKSPGQWLSFARYLRSNNRYVLSEEWKEFVKAVQGTAFKRETKIKKGQLFYRARIGHRTKTKKGSVREYQHPLPKKEMSNPPARSISEGRINPAGISYLYLSDSVTTAISETKPWIGQLVSVGICEVKADLRVVDLRSDVDFLDTCLPWDNGVSDRQKEDRIWWDIDQEFAKPTVDSAKTLDYVPTQYLAEVLKNKGYQGILYRSSLAKDGYNLALYSLDALNIKITKVELYGISGLAYSACKHINY